MTHVIDNSTHPVRNISFATFPNNSTNTDIHYSIGQCSLGAVLAARSKHGLCALLIGDHPEQLVLDLQNQFPEANLLSEAGGQEDFLAKVIALLENPGTDLDLPLDLRGTAFQRKVWNALRRIPAGSTATYTEIAESIGHPGAFRAVAQACAANTLAVAIPCHRVIRNNGELSGYRWGVERKRTLLQKEARA